MLNLKKNFVKGFCLGIAIVFFVSNISWGYPVNKDTLRPPVGRPEDLERVEQVGKNGGNFPKGKTGPVNSETIPEKAGNEAEEATRIGVEYFVGSDTAINPDEYEYGTNPDGTVDKNLLHRKGDSSGVFYARRTTRRPI